MGCIVRAERQGIIVWFQNRRNIKQIKRFGHLIYTSKKLKYAVLYVNQEETEAIVERLKNFSFITKISKSQKPFIRTNFETVKKDWEKEQDYQMGV